MILVMLNSMSHCLLLQPPLWGSSSGGASAGSGRCRVMPSEPTSQVRGTAAAYHTLLAQSSRSARCELMSLPPLPLPACCTEEMGADVDGKPVGPMDSAEMGSPRTASAGTPTTMRSLQDDTVLALALKTARSDGGAAEGSTAAEAQGCMGDGMGTSIAMWMSGCR